MGEARTVIAADLPRTFAAFDAGDSAVPVEVRNSPLFPDEAAGSMGLPARRESLERVLLAVAAQCPSVGYCQGLDVLAAFAFSVAEESGKDIAVAEAESFAFISGLLELDCIRSWMEPPLIGLRTA